MLSFANPLDSFDLNSSILLPQRKKEKLNGPGKVGFVDRLTMNSENKSHEEEIRRLTELSKAMSNLKFSESNKYKLPEVVTSSLDDISSLLTAEETAELRNVVNSSLRSANKAKKDNIKNASLEVQKILGKLGLSDKAFLVYDGLDYKKSISFEVATKEMEKELLSDLTPEYIPININKSEVSLDSGESVLISKIEEMISKRELEPTKSINNIVANIAEIKEAMLTRKKANRITLKISNAMTELNKITEIDITMIKTFLSKIQNKYQKELDKANKFISKFDFSNIKEQIEAKDAKKNKENGIFIETARRCKGMWLYRNDGTAVKASIPTHQGNRLIGEITNSSNLYNDIMSSYCWYFVRVFTKNNGEKEEYNIYKK